jgi:hypothetical protein
MNLDHDDGMARGAQFKRVVMATPTPILAEMRGYLWIYLLHEKL